MLEEGFELSVTKERNLAMELVRVTEAGALNAGHWMGKGNKEMADQAAVDAIRQALDGVDMSGVVVIGEGEKDEAPMLYIGEQVGNGSPPEVDVAVDPVEGTTLLANGLPGSLAVVAIAERGSMYAAPPGVFYMDKIAVSSAAKHVIDINAPVAVNLDRIARAKDVRIEDLTVMLLDRPQCKFWPRSDEERKKLKADGVDLDQVFRTDDLVKGEDVSFAATGITTGELLEGVQYFSWGARTSSVMMRNHSGTIRYIHARHKWRKTLKR